MNVKTIVVDMNVAYFTLAKELFTNAKVIIDRFHIVQLISRSLNQTRIHTMKRFHTSRSKDLENYRKFKNTGNSF
ncbi:transposase [Carnobacterium sp. FSL W8-0810]|uniref:transposase n=1 Tax=Carnobacterium sp. FSL W8-0810 TaxID=2954705 RepID=UPI0030FB2E1B